MPSREDILNKSLLLLKENNYRGTIVLIMGTGKSILVQNVIKELQPKRVLISTPRNMLNESLMQTFNKYLDNDTLSNVEITVKTINSIYNKSEEWLNQFDLYVFDECHMISESYYRALDLIDKDKKVILLTGTPNKELPFKKNVLYKNFPILIEYYDAEKDNITNKIKVFVIEYQLSDLFKIEVNTKRISFKKGEKSAYIYLSKKYDQAVDKMYYVGSTNLVSDSIEWLKSEDPDLKKAALDYTNAMNSRRTFLINLESSIKYAKAVVSKIREVNKSKVLVFSESVSSAIKISNYCINSKNKASYNKELLDKFNKGEIPVLSSVNSLTLGINLDNAKYCVFESFNGSYTSVSQKLYRLSRLNTNDIAYAFFIVPVGTQAATWMDSNNIQYTKITLNDVKKVIE